jgi:membrane protein
LKRQIAIIVKKILDLPILKHIVDWSKRYAFPGFSNVPIFYIIKFIVEEAQKDNLTTRANAVAFSLFISIFPAIIFVFTLLPYLPFTADYTEIVAGTLEGVLPSNIHTYLMDIIYDITSIKRQGLLSLGFILAIFFSSSGMLTLMYGFDKSYHITFKERGYFYKYWIANVLTVTLLAMLVGSIALFLTGSMLQKYVLNTLGYPIMGGLLFSFFKYALFLFVIYYGISLIYKHGPSMKKKTSFFNPGSILATVLLLSASWLFSWFINNFGRYNELYGSIGALVAFLLYLQITSFIILVGFELNAAIAVNRDLMDEEG